MWRDAVSRIEVRAMPHEGYRTGNFPGVIATRLPGPIGFQELRMSTSVPFQGPARVLLSGSRNTLHDSLDVGGPRLDRRHKVVRIPLRPYKGLDSISRAYNFAWWHEVEIPRTLVPSASGWRAALVDPTGHELVSVPF